MDVGDDSILDQNLSGKYPLGKIILPKESLQPLFSLSFGLTIILEGDFD
jgi:hypothetical protein